MYSCALVTGNRKKIHGELTKRQKKKATLENALKHAIYFRNKPKKLATPKFKQSFR